MFVPKSCDQGSLKAMFYLLLLIFNRKGIDTDFFETIVIKIVELFVYKT